MVRSLLKKSKFLVIGALFVVLVTQSGCGRMGMVAARVLVTAAVVATVLAVHDAHYHHHHCGHEYVIVDERDVYHYQGRWEYYDSHQDQWYEYRDFEPRRHHHRH